MGVPLFVALPTLFGFLVDGVAQLAGFFALYVSKRVAVIGAFTVAFLAGWIALQAVAYGTWVALEWSSPPFMQEVFTVVLTLLPDIWLPAVNAIIVFRIAAFVWEQQRAWLVVSSNL